MTDADSVDDIRWKVFYYGQASAWMLAKVEVIAALFVDR